MKRRDAHRTQGRRRADPGTPASARVAIARDGAALACAAALSVAASLVPGEAAAEYGVGAMLILGWLLLAFGWLAATWFTRGAPPQCGTVDAAVVLFLLLHTASGLIHLGDGHARPMVNVVWQWVGLGVGYLLLRQLLRAPANARAICAVMVGLAVALAALGWYQYLIGFPQRRAAFARDPEAMLRDEGIHAPPGSPERRLFVDRLNSTEPTATFALTNSLAGLLAPWITVALGIGVLLPRPWARLENHSLAPVLRGEGWGEGPEGKCGRSASVGPWTSPNRARIATLLAAALMVGCLFLTKSRAGVLATAGGVFLVLLWPRRRQAAETPPLTTGAGESAADPCTETGTRQRGLERWMPSPRGGWQWIAAAAAGLLLVLLGVIAAAFSDRLVLAEAPKSLLYRWQYWRASADLIREHPWFGCGPGNFQQTYPTYMLPEASETIAEPHNFLLEVWATAGTPAALAFALVLALAAWHVLRTISQPVPASSVEADLDELRAVSPFWLYAGGLLGTVLGTLVGLVFGFPADAAFRWLGIPCGIAYVALVQAWTRTGDFPVWLPAAAALVLAVNLSAAGGIGFPGVAQSGWLLLAICESSTSATFRRLTLPRAAVAGMALLFLALAIAQMHTMYRPILACQALLGEAHRTALAGRIDASVQACLAAATADPLSAEPWARLCTLHHARAIETGDGRWRVEFDRAADELLSRNPNSATVFAQLGDWRLMQWGLCRDPQRLAQAVADYNRWVVLHPTSILGHAQLAVVSHRAGDVAAAKRAAETALRLDAQCPHTERKLKQQTLIDPDRQTGDAEDPEARMRQLSVSRPHGRVGWRREDEMQEYRVSWVDFTLRSLRAACAAAGTVAIPPAG